MNMLEETSVDEVMTASPVSIPHNASVADARTALLDHRIGAVPICDSQDRVVGIVTKTDLITAVDDASPATLFATRAVSTLRTTASVLDAARLMRDRRIHHVPITEDDRLCGIISVFDIVGLVADLGPDGD